MNHFRISVLICGVLLGFSSWSICQLQYRLASRAASGDAGDPCAKV